jgi:hypothetical protein
MSNIIDSKYKKPEDQDNYQLGKIYVKKLCTNAFKVIYFISMCTYGFGILKQLDYFPKSLGGNGDMVNMFSNGANSIFFHWKPNSFDFYYLVNLSYHMTDLVWFIFFYEMQTDFLMMFLHHICTISLIVFSYMCNYSNVGCIVMFLHDFADIFVYFCRIIINLDVRSIAKILSGKLLLVVFVYTRIYVLGDLIRILIQQFSFYKMWDAFNTTLTLFLCFLYMLHIYWVYSIIKKICSALFANKIEDTYKVKKLR